MAHAMLSFMLAVFLRPSVHALRNGMDLVPPMGWSNWESFGCDINEDIIKASARALVKKGLRDVGYTIVEIDDCWANSERNSTGHFVANHSKFPTGMKALGKYLHEKKLRFAMYSS